MTENVACPVCNCSSKDPVSKYTVEESATHVCSADRDFDRNKRLQQTLQKMWPKGYCEVFICENCKFGFGVPFNGGNDEFYSILHEQMGYPKWKWDYKIGIEKISKKKVKSILDIGAGAGFFLGHLPDEIDKFAIESTPTMISKLNKIGVKCFNSFEQIKKTSNSKFDVITIFQVLEHISEFNDILLNCYRLLNEDGVLLITVPSGERMLKQEKILGHPDMPPNHINKWSPESLEIALNKVGLKIDLHQFEPGNFRNLQAKLHMKSLALSLNKNSIMHKVSKIKSKKMRIISFTFLSPFVFISLIKNIKFLTSGGSFFVAASKKIG